MIIPSNYYVIDFIIFPRMKPHLLSSPILSIAFFSVALKVYLAGREKFCSRRGGEEKGGGDWLEKHAVLTRLTDIVEKKSGKSDR